MDKARIMLSWAQSILTPPGFEDEEKDRLVQLLHPILLFGVIAETLAVLLLLLGTSRAQYMAAITGSAAMSSLMFLILLRRGYVKPVGYAMAFTVWGLCTFAIARNDGIQSPAVGFLVFAIIYGFLVFNRRTGLFFYMLSMATLGLITAADSWGLLPEPIPTSKQAIALIYVLIFSVSGWVVDVVTRSLRRSLTRAREAEQQLHYKADLQALVTRLATEFVNLPSDQVAHHIQRAMQTASTLVRANACRLWTFSDDHATMTLIKAWDAPDVPAIPHPPTAEMPTAQHTWLLAQLVRMETVYVRSVDELPPEAASLRARWTREAVQSGLYVPLAVSGHLVGFLSYFTTQPALNWTADVTQLLALVGTVIVQALERQRAEAQHHALITERERIAVMHEFIGNVTHDIRNPLAVIGTSLYIARNTDDPEHRKASLDIIATQADRINALVEDLLLLARLDTTQSIERAEVDLRLLLEDVITQLQPLAHQKQLAYEAHLPQTLPPVLAHADDIRRVFVNLIENAIRYTAEGRSISVQANVEPRIVSVEVADTGIGIAAHDLPQVFERFFRADNARSMSDRGTGLGLAIVQRIVDQHGGYVDVESVVDQGSTFRVALPRCDVSGSPQVSM